MDKNFKFSGSLIVEVDPVRIEAKMALVKASADSWDWERLTEYLLSMGVKEGWVQKDLEAQLTKFAQSREERIDFVFARGTLPEPATPEEVQWQDFSIPDDLKGVAQRLFQKNPSPEVFDVRTEKVEVKKQVEVKGGLFGQKKTETKMVMEAKKIRERVVAPSAVEATGYFQADSLLAQLYPFKPGKPGRDLMGRGVPPPVPKSARFFLGDGIEKTREGLVTNVTGFVRRGDNWVEVLPFQPHRFQIRFTEDRTGAFLDFKPGSIEAPIVDANTVFSMLEKDGFASDRVIGRGDVEAAIRKSMKTGVGFDGLSLMGKTDGRFEVSISTDKLSAVLQIHKPIGNGERIDLKKLESELQDLHIKDFNLKEVMIRVKGFLASDKTVLENFILAKGLSPTRNPDKKVKFVVDFLSDENLKTIHQRIQASKALQDSIPGWIEFPMGLVQRGAVVPENAVVAILESVGEPSGQTGRDIFGNAIPAFPGRDPVLQFFGNIRCEGDSVVAYSDGLVEIGEDSGITVIRLQAHKDAVVEVVHSSDHMSARMTLWQAVGSGKPLTTSMIEDAMKQEQVLEGIDRDAIAQALETARRRGKAEAVVARGRAPGSNLLARMDFQVATRYDTKNDLTLGSVSMGSIIAVYTPTDGTCLDGVDILGNVIPCAEIEKDELTLGPGLSLRQTTDPGKIHVVAERGGEFLFDGSKMSLKDTLHLPHGARTQEGNRRFAGHLAIEGDVDSGLAIYAGGDLKVNGNTGACLLSGGINVIVAGVVRGGGKAVLSSKKHLSVYQAEKAVLMSVGDTIIQHTALGCTIKCNGRIRQNKAEGTISGGSLRSKYGVEAFNLGHPSKRDTLVSFGQDYLVEDQIKTEEKEVDKIRHGIVALDRMMLLYTDPKQRLRLDTVRKKKVLLLKMLEKRGRKLIFLRDKFDVHYPSEIIVKGYLYPGVNIESHGRLYEVRQKKRAVRITFNLMTGKIEEVPL